jgi:hypothetical protein
VPKNQEKKWKALKNKISNNAQLFAAQFMAALLANPEYTTEDFHAIARDAISAADILLKELNND